MRRNLHITLETISELYISSHSFCVLSSIRERPQFVVSASIKTIYKNTWINVPTRWSCWKNTAEISIFICRSYCIWPLSSNIQYHLSKIHQRTNPNIFFFHFWIAPIFSIIQKVRKKKTNLYPKRWVCNYFRLFSLYFSRKYLLMGLRVWNFADLKLLPLLHGIWTDEGGSFYTLVMMCSAMWINEKRFAAADCLVPRRDPRRSRRSESRLIV